MIQAVLFDMDGVLVDSQTIHYNADRMTLLYYGIETDNQTLEKYAGTTTPNRMQSFQRDFGVKESLPALCEKQGEILEGLLRDSVMEAIEGIPDLLTALSEKGYRLGVASSTKRRLVELILEKIKIKRFFEEVTTGDEVANGKPAPDIFLAAAKKFTVLPQNCLVIEDSENGVQAGKAAGMKVIGFQNATTGKQNLHQADFVIESFQKLSMAQIEAL